MRIRFAEPSLPKQGTLAVGVLADRVLTPAAAELDRQTGGLLGRAMAAAPKFKGNKEELLTLLAPPGIAEPGSDLARIVLVGLGAADKLDRLVLQRIGGALQAQLDQQGETSVTIRFDPIEGAAIGPAEIAALGYGALLRSYRFDKYRTRQKPEAKPALDIFTVATADPAAAATAFAQDDKVAEGVFFTRDLVSEPPNFLHPESFAERCGELTALGVEVEMLDAAQMRALGMGALLGVAQGSAREPRLAPYFAIGDRVIVLIDGVAYEVTID